MSNRNENLIPTAAQIKAHRKSLGLSQVGYGALIGVSGATISDWERSRWSVGSDNLPALLSLMETGATPNPQTVTIDWQALVSDHQGVRGVSLRHLVELGLFGQYRDAAAALERDPRLFALTTKSISLPSTGGRPGEDIIITDLQAVQMFCARARTTMGSRILEVILSHHNELQAMLAGDADAQERHEQAKAAPAPDPLDALAVMLDQLRQQRDALAAQTARQQQLEREVEVVSQSAQLNTELMSDTTARLAAVETQLNAAPIAGDLSAYQIAQRGGYVSSTGRPHDSAVVALGLELGLAEEGEAYQIMREINDHLCPSWRYKPNGAAMILNELRRIARQTKDPFFNVTAGTKTYTVYRAQ